MTVLYRLSIRERGSKYTESILQLRNGFALQYNFLIRHLSMRTFLVVLLLSPVISFGFYKDSTGTLSGSIFRTDNHNSHSPEVGAEIKLYDESTVYFKDGIPINEDKIVVGKSDIEGRFSLKNLIPGKYLVVINSHESIADPLDVFNSIKFTSQSIKKVSNYDFRAANKPMIVKIDSLFDKLFDLRNARETKKADKVQTEVNKQIDILLKSLPSEIKYLLRVNGSYTTSKHVEVTNIKEGVNNDLIVEFK